MSKLSKSAGASLERYLRHWRERGALMTLPEQNGQTLPITIAVSQECGVNGRGIAKAIGQQLDWPVYDRELVEMISEDTGVHTHLLDSIDEKSPHWLAECLDTFQQEKTISGSGYAIRLIKVLFALSGHGNCVVMGRGAAQVLPVKQTLRVRLVAPLAERITEIQQQKEMSYKEAKKHIEEVDKERAAFVKGYFHKDVSDPHGYDLLANSLRIGIDQTAKLILLAQKYFTDSLMKK